MRALLDVNVLIALLDADHSLHALATEWFASHARTGWASCPISQNGCVRIMSSQGYPNALPVLAVMERLAEASASSYHQFWPDDISLLENERFEASRIHGRDGTLKYPRIRDDAQKSKQTGPRHDNST